jgi:predicted RNA binding protein YcfA (HicA-like mRNA interferase family)
MPATFDLELRRVLRRAGCYSCARARGSHEIWSNRRFVLPAAIVSRHTANGVLKDAGLPKAF